MASAASSSSSSLGSTQSPSMASIPAFQMLNHTLPVKLDRTNYVLWRSQMDNVVFANGFENFIEGISICPQKETSDGLVNPDFVVWRRQDRMILSWIYSFLTPGIMAQIIGHTTSYSAWIALEKIFSSSSRARQDQIMNLLGGLGADYNAMVTAINTRDDKISLEAVHSMLLSFEHRLEQQNSVEDASNMTANLASSNNRGGGTRRSNGGRSQGNNSQNYYGRDISSCLWMIFPDSHGFILCRQRIRHYLFSNNLKSLLKISLTLLLSAFNLTMEENLDPFSPF
ncbi:hypothetical protein UlMin_039867 [Ulmus minor]